MINNGLFQLYQISESILFFILEWILKILIFFGFWIIIIVYLFIKNYYRVGSLNYNIRNYDILNHALIFFSNKKKMRGITVLEIQNIPKNISSREQRIFQKNIEKVTYGDNKVYFHYHLTVLLNYVPNLGYEIAINKNRVRLRLFLTLESKNINNLALELKNLAD